MPGSARWVDVGGGWDHGPGRGPSPAGPRGGAVLRPTGVVVFATVETPARRYGLAAAHEAMSRVAPSVALGTPPGWGVDRPTAAAHLARRGLGHVVTWLLGR